MRPWEDAVSADAEGVTVEGAAIYTWDLAGLMVLIPKKRGRGFLRCPLHHHYVAALSDIEIEECVDLCGLDGYLQLNYGYVHDDAEQARIVDRVMPKLAAHFEFTAWRESHRDFWECRKRMDKPRSR